MFTQNNLENQNHLVFVQSSNTSNLDFLNIQSVDSADNELINLKKQLKIILESVPRVFTITSNNNSYKFNTEFLKDISSVIKKFVSANPDSLEYHIDINDELNVMSKFEQLFLGDSIEFDEKEIITLGLIFNTLQIVRCPSFVKFRYVNKSLVNLSEVLFINIKYGIVLSETNMFNFFAFNTKKKFKIETKRTTYQCNYFGVLISRVIREKIAVNPEMDRFKYDFDDEFNEFKDILSLFDFRSIKITTNNMDNLKKISSDLEIDFLLDKLDHYYDQYENSVQRINDKQLIIDEIDDIFELLYDIRKITVKTVKDKILSSDWIESIGSVKELAACILQVINADFVYHPYLIELIQLLNEEVDESNNLKVLIPTILHNLLESFAKTKLNCSFIFLMIKNGFLSIEKVIEKILSIDPSLQDSKVKNSYVEPNIHNNIILWFFPELLEILKIDSFQCIQNIRNQIYRAFIQKFTEKVAEFKKMREAGEPNDEINKSLRDDDVDRFQKFVSTNSININSHMPFNIFEEITNKEVSFINYAAYCGSINCFKYLLLNHAKLQYDSYFYAVYGGNIEIVRIISNDSNELINGSRLATRDISINGRKEDLRATIEALSELNIMRTNVNPIFLTILKHHDELFEWILQNDILRQGKAGKDFIDLVIFSIINGNAHSLVECVNQGFDFNSISKTKVVDLISIASTYGYYKLVLLIFDFAKDYFEKDFSEDTEQNKIKLIFDFPKKQDICCTLFNVYRSSITFGNIMLFKLIIEKLNLPNEDTMSSCLFFLIQKKFEDMIKYIFEDLQFQFSVKNMNQSLILAIENKYDDIFIYLINKFKIVPDQSVLLSACKNINFQVAKIVIDLIFESKPSFDFSEAFIQAGSSGSEEICQYLIDKKVHFNVYNLESNAFKLIKNNEKTFFMLIDILDPESQFIVKSNSLLKEAIESHKKEVVKYLLNENVELGDALFIAIEAKDFEIFDMILNHNQKPSFVNQVLVIKGTALLFAVQTENLEFIQRLLLVPGINPSLSNSNSETPLIRSVSDLNSKIMNEIIDFYGDEIQNQLWQVNRCLEILLTSSRDNKKFEERKIILNRLVRIKNVNLNIKTHNTTLLSYICELDQIELLRFLLENESENLDINLYSIKSSTTALCTAIALHRNEAAKMLIENPKCNINMRDFNSTTPLILAAENDNLEIVECIVKNEKFDPVESHLNKAFMFSTDVEVLRSLSKVEGLDVNYPPLNPQLLQTITNKNIEKIEIITSHSSFNLVRSQLLTAIDLSFKYSLFNVFKMLIKLVNNRLLVFDENQKIYVNFYESAKLKNKMIFNKINEHLDEYDMTGINIDSQ